MSLILAKIVLLATLASVITSTSLPILPDIDITDVSMHYKLMNKYGCVLCTVYPRPQMLQISNSAYLIQIHLCRVCQNRAKLRAD